ncbi:bacteriophage CI repressor-like protein [Buttiauxella sp. JUb87]|uniref:phage repressor protein CI n=1 Tax=Buttiauxella sp. JUb87 TaxID=2485129 RepID=UPI001061091D|nr:phage repressor protein CI [Buttiauxella sp. JUb87]TDN51010.1 bacteriophage CI repressor-like protein [Buttiauxella sp. JUb87]
MGTEDERAEAVLQRILSSYGFTMQKELSEKLDIARNNISGWLQRNSIPASVILQCALDTGADVNWLVKGELKKVSFDSVRRHELQGKDLFDLMMSSGGKSVLRRILDAYGFTTQKQLGDLLDISSGTMSAWVRRDFFPGDVVVACALDTGVSLLWLATGQGDKYKEEHSNESFKQLTKFVINTGNLIESGKWVVDTELLDDPTEDLNYVTNNKFSWIVDFSSNDISNGRWLLSIDGDHNVYDVIRIPGNKIIVKNHESTSEFTCAMGDVQCVGMVIVTIIKN